MVPSTDKTTVKRSHEVRKALGAADPWIWCENDDEFARLHPHADPLAILEEVEEEQTFAQFVNMARREPNERGTGRWKLTPDRQTIGIVALDAGVPKETLTHLQIYLRAFFHTLAVEIHEAHTLSVAHSNTLMVQPNQKSNDRVKKKKAWKLETCKIDKEPHLEAFSLFDAMVSSQVLLNHYYCLVGITSHNLAEKWVDDSNCANCDAVLGRACGDRVCVVQAPSAVACEKHKNNGWGSWRSFLATCTHEALHCFGMDHCVTFRCLMNSQSVLDEECLFLSPLNLKKWVVGVMGIKANASSSEQVRYILARYKAMKQALEALALPDGETEVEWLNCKQQLVEQCTRKAEACQKQTRKRKRPNAVTAALVR